VKKWLIGSGCRFDGRSAASDEANRQGWRLPHRMGGFGMDMGHPIVTNRDFVASFCKGE